MTPSQLTDAIAAVRAGHPVPAGQLSDLLNLQYFSDPALVELAQLCRETSAAKQQLLDVLRGALERYVDSLVEFEPSFPEQTKKWFAPDCICEALGALGADTAFAEALVEKALRGPCDVTFLRPVIGMLLRADKPAAIRAFTRVVDEAKGRPQLLFKAPAELHEAVARAMVRTIACHLPTLRKRSNFWLVGSATEDLLSSTATRAVADAIRTEAGPWDDDTIAAFFEALTQFSFYADEAPQHRDAILRDVIPHLLARHKGTPAWAKGAGPKRMLARLGFASSRGIATLPDVVPVNLADAMALRKSHRVTRKELAQGRPLKKLPARTGALELPAELAELYTLANGIDRFVVSAAKLAPLQRRLARGIAEHLADEDDEDPPEHPDLDLRRFAPYADLLAIGTDHGGDFFFLHCATRTAADTCPVLRFVHDESLTVRPEARSIGAFVALLLLERWAEREGETHAFEQLRSREHELAAPTNIE